MFNSEWAAQSQASSFVGAERSAGVLSSSAFPHLDLAGQRSQDPHWLLVDEGFTLAREHEVESQFAISNGYVGNRGSLAEGSPLSAPATFVAGVFEMPQKEGAVPGLFLMPDWTGVRAWIADQPLSMTEGQALEHRRILDMHRGVLWREWRHRGPDGRVTHITALRLASLADRHLLLQSVFFTPENYSAHLRLECCIALPPEALPWTPPEEWKTRQAAARPNILPLALHAPGRSVVVAVAACSQLQSTTAHPGRREIELDQRSVTERFSTELEIGAEYRLDRLISVYTSREESEPLQAAVEHVNRVIPRGITPALAAHSAAWEERWQRAGITVTGDDELQRALRFATYHLISAANPEDERVSIGARALTGESYKGHVFWDTEIYMLPFYIFTHPPSARALLMYRYHTLPAARGKARAAGFHGAMYPWESADTGEETTPRWVVAPGGEVIEVLNGEMENHITADIAYAVWQYWQMTGDDEFLLVAGAEILLESARFWASRGSVEADGLYHIRHVIGPDEYHENVDDSAYTNLMAAWNMARGVELAQILERRWPQRWRELAEDLQLSPVEIASWSEKARLMHTGFDPRTKLFETFAGYFLKEPVDLKKYEPRSTAMDVILGHARIQQTNVVKQADVVLAMFLLWDRFPSEVRKANFHYYEPRTGHGSSLSPGSHALLAARLGEMETAARYLQQASEIDLSNNMGNAAGGVHAAAVGGLWQAMVFGFAGLEARSEGLCLNPRLLPHWKAVIVPLEWRGRKLRIELEPAVTRVTVEDGPAPLKLQLAGGPELDAYPRRQYLAERAGRGWSNWKELR